MGLIIPVALIGSRSYTPPLVGNNSVLTTYVDGSNNYYIGGSFSILNAQNRNRLALLNSSQVLDGTYNPNLSLTYELGPSVVKSMKFQNVSGGKLLIAGTFNNINGQSYRNIGRLNFDSTGSVDTGFNIVTFSSNLDTVQSILVDTSDQSVFIAGSFSTLKATTRNNIGKITSDGSALTSFTANTNGQVMNLANDPTDSTSIFICGYFSTVKGTTRRYLCKVNKTTGNVVASFNANTLLNLGGTYCGYVSVLSTGNVVVGGTKSASTNPSITDLTILNPNGSLNTIVNSIEPSYSITALNVDSTDKIFCATFVAFNNSRRIYKLNSDGTLDTGFGSGNGYVTVLGGNVSSIEFNSLGNIVIGGGHSNINGTPTNLFTILDSAGNVIPP